MSAGLPPSRTNEWVGEYVPEFRLDHYWAEQRVGVEADGLGKYLANPAAAIRTEKAREWQLQRMGIRVVRYGWTVMLRSPDLLAARVRELLDAPPLPPGRLRTWPNQEGRALLGMDRVRRPTADPGRADPRRTRLRCAGLPGMGFPAAPGCAPRPPPEVGCAATPGCAPRPHPGCAARPHPVALI